MPNDVTRGTSLVNKDEVIQTGPFGKTIHASVGFSNEIFRDGRHEASVRFADETVSNESSPALHQYKVRNRDRVLTVSLGPAQLPLKGSFYTKDRYNPSYEVQLELKVNNPSLFARRYVQESDPVYILQMAIVQEFSEYAERTDHDQLNKTKLRHDAQYNIQSAKVGIVVTAIYKSEIYADETKARIRQEELEAEVKKSNITITAEVERIRATEASTLDAIERFEKAKDKDFEREQKKKDEDMAIEQKMKQALTSHLANLLITEMSNVMRGGDKTVDEIVDDSPILKNMLTPLFESHSATAISGRQTQAQLPESTTVRERQDGPLPPFIPPQDNSNSPKIPIPESDIAQYREAEENS